MSEVRAQWLQTLVATLFVAMLGFGTTAYFEIQQRFDEAKNARVRLVESYDKKLLHMGSRIDQVLLLLVERIECESATGMHAPLEFDQWTLQISPEQ